MIVSITGATGFIGQRLVLRHLALGDQVRVLSRRTPNEIRISKELKWFQGDLIGTDSLHAFLDGTDVLYHCAGEVSNSKVMESLHVAGTKRLAAAAAGRIGHWVQLSSVGVYGQASSGTITESSPIKPIGQYEITKKMSERVVVEEADSLGFSYSILRPSNVYGATMTNQSLFKMISMIDKGLFFYIGQPGASANYIHVDNVVEGLVRCGTMDKAKGKVFNLSDYCTLEHFVETITYSLGRATPLLRIPKSLAVLLAETLGRTSIFPLTNSRVNALVNRTTYPISYIQTELGYRHLVSMEDGLREIVHHYKHEL